MRVFRSADGGVRIEWDVSWDTRAQPRPDDREQQLAASERAKLVVPTKVTFKDWKPA